MIGVRFNRAMRPYGAGDTAYLPDDVAAKVIADGDAEKLDLPAAPHAASLGEASPMAEAPVKPAKPKKQGFQTKLFGKAGA